MISNIPKNKISFATFLLFLCKRLESIIPPEYVSRVIHLLFISGIIFSIIKNNTHAKNNTTVLNFDNTKKKKKKMHAKKTINFSEKKDIA